MPSNRPMPISPMPIGDFTPAMLAYEQGNDGQTALGLLSRTWTGILGKAGPLTDFFLPFYAALREPATNVLGFKLTELVRLAVATTTSCEACISAVDPRSGLDLNVVSLFDELDRADFSPRERAAIRYTLTFCTNHHKVDDSLWAELKSLFTDQELVTLCMFVATFLGTGRLAHAMRLIDANCTLPGYRLSELVKAKAAQEAPELVP
jgi:hypothetical protein